MYAVNRLPCDCFTSINELLVYLATCLACRSGDFVDLPRRSGYF